MPKAGKKGNKKCTLDNVPADVTLADFANSRVSASRIRKPTNNSLAREVRIFYSKDKSWFERDLEEFETLSIGEDIETLTVGDKRKASRTKSHHSENSCASPDVPFGIHYPLDLWFLIAEYIHPEDVQIFASLCKSSYYVIQTYKFWMGIYKRFYKSGIQLPVRLQPQCIERPNCLRVCVIRALYHMYPLFVSQLSPRPTSSWEVYKLVNSLCIYMWRQQHNGKWLFFFKFRSLPFSSNSYAVMEHQEPSLWTSRDITSQNNPLALLNDVNSNPDEGCKVLRVTSSHFVAAPPVVMGSRLADVHVSLSRDMSHQKLQLTFTFSSYKRRNSCTPSVVSGDGGGNGEIIEFDPVENMVVLNWWHPQYPTGNKF